VNRGLLDELDRRLLKPIRDSMRNMIARGVVQLVDDGKKLQMMQAGVLAGEPKDDVEHFQPYGFSSSPLPGAELVIVFVAGDRDHPIAIASSDRRYRPTGAQPGEVIVYNNAGAKATLTKDGDIHLQAAPGRQVLVDDGSGAEPLVKRSEFLAHGHATAGTGPPIGPSPVTAMPPTSFPGTTVLQGK
jgi:phage baseplate assembly protein V